jgi:hypothetical protein
MALGDWHDPPASTWEYLIDRCTSERSSSSTADRPNALSDSSLIHVLQANNIPLLFFKKPKQLLGIHLPVYVTGKGESAFEEELHWVLSCKLRDELPGVPVLVYGLDGQGATHTVVAQSSVEGAFVYDPTEPYHLPLEHWIKQAKWGALLSVGVLVSMVKQPPEDPDRASYNVGTQERATHSSDEQPAITIQP